jgi:trehalose-6-phosphatase
VNAMEEIPIEPSIREDVRALRELYRDHTQIIAVSLARIEVGLTQLNTNIRIWVETGRSLIKLARWIVLALTLTVIASLGQSMSIDISHDKGIRIRRNLHDKPAEDVTVKDK